MRSMSGKAFKDWMKKNRISKEEIGFKLGITTQTVFRWFSKPEIDRNVILALNQLGYSLPLDEPGSAKTGTSGA
jgi:hypothetical protein